MTKHVEQKTENSSTRNGFKLEEAMKIEALENLKY